MGSVDDILGKAHAASSEGDLAACHAIAAGGLVAHPDDPRLLALAGRAALDLGAADAVDLLRRLVAVVPDDAGAWRDLGLAELDAGDGAAAVEALRAALARDPDDASAQVSLGHVLYAMGDVEGAAALLARAAAEDPDDPAPLRNLLEMYRMAGRTREALETAQALAERAPDDVIALIDLGELHLDLGDHDAAAAAYQRMRRAEADTDHVTYAYHGLIEVELRREGWRRALDLAIAATALDRHQLTTDLLALVTAKLFGEGDRPAPPRAEVERQLAAQRARHRRVHEEALVSERVTS